MTRVFWKNHSAVQRQLKQRSRGEEAHGFPVTAIEREGNPHPLAIVAADLEAIGAPRPIALIDRNAAVMPPLDTASMAIEQQAMDLHRPVDPLVIGRL